MYVNNLFVSNSFICVFITYPDKTLELLSEVREGNPLE